MALALAFLSVVLFSISMIGSSTAGANEEYNTHLTGPQTSPWFSSTVSPIVQQRYGCTSYSGEVRAAASRHCPAKQNFTTDQGPYWHSGIDIGNIPAGTPIYSPFAGTVVSVGPAAGSCGGFGAYYPTIRLDDGHDVILGHVQRPVVLTPGQRIVPGQLVAYVGSQGCSSGAHLHFEVRPAGGRFGTDVDPTAWLVPQLNPPSGHHYFKTTGASLRVRSGAGTGYSIVRTLGPTGTVVDINCQARSSSSLNGSSMWDNLADGGWITDYYVNTPNFNNFSPGIPRCDSTHRGMF